MKEVIAIIRRNKLQKTKEALATGGYLALNFHRVFGRGKQRGLKYEFFPPLDVGPLEKEQVALKFIPKVMLSLVVEDNSVQQLVEIIVEVNQTGHIGDGKIFVCPIKEALRVRTEERGAQALL